MSSGPPSNGLSHHSLAVSLESRFGLRNLQDEWKRRQTGFEVDILVGPICRTDLCEITTGSLPWNILDAHSVQLNTKVLVQVEDVINIASADPRSADMPRNLQMTLTDGRTEFVGVELESLGSRISLRTVPGTKLVLLPTALVRRGRVLLTAKDFTFLGAPSANVWGPSYDKKIADTLVAAGLPNPKASTFDSITGTSGDNATRAARGGLPDMGGIADAIPSSDEFNDDDEEFWTAAAAAADRTVAELSAVRSPETQPRQTNPPNGENGSRSVVTAVVSANVETSNSETRGSPFVASPSDMPLDEPHPEDDIMIVDSPGKVAGPTKSHKTFIPDTDEDTREPIDIPEMPVFESDPAFDDAPQAVNQASIVIDSSSDEEVVNILNPKALPLSRLEEMEETRVEGADMTWHRAYSVKLSRKHNIQVDKGNVVISIAVDDGTGVKLLPLRPECAQRITGISSDRDLFQGNFEERCMAIRKSTRALCGFVKVEHDDDGSFVADVVNRTPLGMVS